MISDASVDVLLPVFNGAGTIEEAICSLLCQTVKNINIIVIDDGSTDSSLKVIERLARTDHRITTIIQNNCGIVDALNVGLERSSAEFVSRQDADDISRPTRLALELEYLKSHQECVAVSGAVEHIDEDGLGSGTIQRFLPPDLCDPFWAPSREPYLMHPFLMVRRDDLVSVGGYRYAFHSEDTDLYWRLIERGKLHNLDAVLGSYRIHAKSISGGSIINGRIMAVSSQLAALSARRRREGRPDISFSKEAISAYREAQTTSKICKLAIRGLNDEESRYLRIAVAGKILELSAYRPYELDADDCRFIRNAYREFKFLSAPNRRQLGRLHAAAVARLVQKRLFREAVELAPPALYGSVIARVVAAGMLPSATAKYISRLRTHQ